MMDDEQLACGSRTSRLPQQLLVSVCSGCCSSALGTACRILLSSCQEGHLSVLPLSPLSNYRVFLPLMKIFLVYCSMFILGWSLEALSSLEASPWQEIVQDSSESCSLPWQRVLKDQAYRDWLDRNIFHRK